MSRYLTPLCRTTQRNNPRKGHNMKFAIAVLESSSPYSQSRAHDAPKLDRETADAHEQRTWREKCHYFAESRRLYIPPMAFKMGLDRTAKYFGKQIPGKGKSTYTKHFLSGVLCTDPIPIRGTVDEIPGETILANADGVRGSGKRVKRTFPRIDHWKAPVIFAVLDDTITRAVFEETLAENGQFTGIGRFRPENGGFYGRYSVEKVEWVENASPGAALAAARKVHAKLQEEVDKE